MTKSKFRIVRVRICFGLLALTCFSACVSPDSRKLSSPLRKSIQRSDSNKVIQEKFLHFTPLGMSRTEVHRFLVNNFKASAVEEPPQRFDGTSGASMISAHLWTRYATFGVQFETDVRFDFDKKGRLDQLSVSTADASF